MSKKYKPTEDTPDLIPYLTVKDAEASIKFYKEAFGFEMTTISRDESGNPMHIEMKRKNAVVMFCPEGAFDNPNKSPATLGVNMPINLYVYCEDADKLYNQAVQCGAISKIAPRDAFWGDRFCALTDIDGYEWSFGTHLGNE